MTHWYLPRHHQARAQAVTRYPHQLHRPVGPNEDAQDRFCLFLNRVLHETFVQGVFFT